VNGIFHALLTDTGVGVVFTGARPKDPAIFRGKIEQPIFIENDARRNRHNDLVFGLPAKIGWSEDFSIALTLVRMQH
jgi:hypothetical protein